MNKRLISIVAVLVALTVTWAAFAQRDGAERPRRGAGGAGRGGFGNLSEEERANMRERFQNMSEEERTKYREQMRARFENMSDEERTAMRSRMGSRFGGGRSRLSKEDQLKAVSAIQDQLAKLKKAIEASSPPNYSSFRDLSAEDRTKLREKMTKDREDRQKVMAAIQTEIDKLGGSRPPTPPAITAGELTAIRELALKEKAEGTVKRLDALIAKQRSAGSRGFGGGRGGPGGGAGGARGERGAGGARRPGAEGGARR